LPSSLRVDCIYIVVRSNNLDYFTLFGSIFFIGLLIGECYFDLPSSLSFYSLIIPNATYTTGHLGSIFPIFSVMAISSHYGSESDPDSSSNKFLFLLLISSTSAIAFGKASAASMYSFDFVK
jgi:hypothetical protein